MFKVVWSYGDESVWVESKAQAIAMADIALDDTAMVVDESGRIVWTWYGEDVDE